MSNNYYCSCGLSGLSPIMAAKHGTSFPGHVIRLDNYRDDPVNSPAHYNRGNIECIDAIEAATSEFFVGYLQGNALKYLYRYRYKDNPVQDLRKAIWYIEKLIEKEENDDSKRIPDGASQECEGESSPRADSGSTRYTPRPWAHQPELPETD